MATATMRVIEAGALTYRRVWRGSVITTFLNPVLFLTAMGVILGRGVDDGAGGATLGGLTYLQFLATGLVAAQAMQSGAIDGAWPVMAGIKWTKTYQAMLSTPVGVGALVRGHVGWLFIKLTGTAVVFVVIATLFGAMPLWPGLLAVFPAALTGTAFGAAMTAWTARLERETGLTTMFRFVILPLYLFSGSFFPVSQLPDWLEPLAHLTPIFHGVELTRRVAFGFDAVYPGWMSVLYLTAWVVVASVLAHRILERRLLP